MLTKIYILKILFWLTFFTSNGFTLKAFFTLFTQRFFIISFSILVMLIILTF